MSFATPITGDAASPRPVGFGFCTVAYTIVNDAGGSGGTITTPFATPDGIEIASWTPDTFPSAVPAILSASLNATTGLIDVVIETDIDAGGVIRLTGRGGN